MKKFLALSLLLATLAACQDDGLPSGTTECIKDKVDAFSKLPNARNVQLAIVNGEDQYWFNDGASEQDLPEFVFDAACEQVCFFCGGCAPSSCVADYADAEWSVIWEK